MKQMEKTGSVLVLVLGLFLMIELCWLNGGILEHTGETGDAASADAWNNEYGNSGASYTLTDSLLSQQENLMAAQAAIYDRTHIEEDEIYSFLQGPRAWSEGWTWSGEWCQYYTHRNSFGGFGCGLCCAANIYSTLSPYTCSPLDAFDLATSVSGYSVTRKSGAIGWGDLKTTLQYMGMDCDVYTKPDDYATFQSQMAEAQSAIVLVSSYNDDTYWTSTSGHYVNIYLYDSETDTVFLTEPGSPENNRSRIPLQYVYDALKTSSKFQYILVESYNEADNQWLHDGIDDNWVSP